MEGHEKKTKKKDTFQRDNSFWDMENQRRIHGGLINNLSLILPDLSWTVIEGGDVFRKSNVDNDKKNQVTIKQVDAQDRDSLMKKIVFEGSSQNGRSGVKYV